MRAVVPTRPAPAPYAAAEAAFAEAKAYLSSREAQQMSESKLERELQRRGQAWMRKLLQGHLEQRGLGEAAGPVTGADGVERSGGVGRRTHLRGQGCGAASRQPARVSRGKASRVAAAMRRAATVAGLSKDTRKSVDTCADYLQKYAPYLQCV